MWRKVKASLKAAGVDHVLYDEVVIEPTDRSFQDAARFARESNGRRFRVRGRRIGDRHVQGGQSLREASLPSS